MDVVGNEVYLIANTTTINPKQCIEAIDRMVREETEYCFRFEHRFKLTDDFKKEEIKKDTIGNYRVLLHGNEAGGAGPPNLVRKQNEIMFSITFMDVLDLLKVDNWRKGDIAFRQKNKGGLLTHKEMLEEVLVKRESMDGKWI